MAEEIYFLYIKKLGHAPKQARDLLRFAKSMNKTLSWRESGELVQNPPNRSYSSVMNTTENIQFSTQNTSQIIELLNTVQSPNTYLTKQSTFSKTNLCKTNKSAVNINQSTYILAPRTRMTQMSHSIHTNEEKCNATFSQCIHSIRIKLVLERYDNIISDKTDKSDQQLQNEINDLINNITSSKASYSNVQMLNDFYHIKYTHNINDDANQFDCFHKYLFDNEDTLKCDISYCQSAKRYYDHRNRSYNSSQANRNRSYNSSQVDCTDGGDGAGA
eukprot:320076_1